MTSKYVTASRARHVTFPRVFPIGLWGVRYSLFIIYSWYYLITVYFMVSLLLYRYGWTKVVISDQGREFVNKVSKYLNSITKTEHRITSAYHPQTNGIVERFNQTLQRSLVKFINKNQTDWDEKLDGILFAYRTSQHQSSKVTPFELMYCR